MQAEDALGDSILAALLGLVWEEPQPSGLGELGLGRAARGEDAAPSGHVAWLALQGISVGSQGCWRQRPPSIFRAVQGSEVCREE